MKPIDKVMRQGLVSLYKDLTGVELQVNKELTRIKVGTVQSFNKQTYDNLLEDMIETYKSLSYNSKKEGNS